MSHDKIIVHGVAQIEVTTQTADNAPSVNKRLLAERVTIDNPNHRIRETTITDMSNIDQVTQFRQQEDKLVTGTVDVFIRTVISAPTRRIERVEAILNEARDIVMGERYTVKGVEVIDVKPATATEDTEITTGANQPPTPEP